MAKTAVTKTAAKKPATAKAASKKEVRAIKYTDKSPGQPQLAPIYNQLRQFILTFAKGTVQVVNDTPGQLHLHSFKTIEVSGKKKDEIYFAGLLVQKGYVGFYLMPVYTHVSLKKEIAPQLLKCLKGKACFHIKQLDEGLGQQVTETLEAGFKYYVQNGWIDDIE